MSKGYGSLKTLSIASNDNNFRKIDVNEYINDLERQDDVKKFGRGKFLIFLVILAISGVIAYSRVDLLLYSKISTVFIQKPPVKATPINVSNNQVSKTIDPTIMSLTATNEYGEYQGAYPWLESGVLVEPYKLTTLTLSGNSVDNSYFVWSIDYEDEILATTTDPTYEITLYSTGNYFLTVKAYDVDTDELKETKTATLFCKYVKRELRSLTIADREKFLDAAVIMWKIDTEAGKAIYGDNYYSIQSFTEEHALASNDIRCDSFHEGSGFLTHHLAITNSFEASLRAIDPSVTLPYWDFTIEGQQIKEAGQSPSYFLEVTPFLSDEWFGSVDENDHIIDSRWKGTAMPKATETTTVSPNSYGYIRSYWNNNNDKEVTRHLFDICGYEATNKLIPSCSSHYDVLNTKTLGSFQLLSPSDGHGPLHVHLGGMGGDCTQVFADFMEKYADVLNADMTQEEVKELGLEQGWQWGYTAPRMAIFRQEIMGEYFHIYRSLWRSHMCARDNTPQLLECPEYCDVDTPMSECKCSIAKYETGETDWEDVYYCVLSTRVRNTFLKLFGEDFVVELIDTISNTSIKEGEMLEAASPADITFWVIHPTIERLLIAKRLPNVNFMGTSVFQKWGTVDGSEESWLSYSYYSQAENANKYYTDAYTCVGHEATDPVLPDKLPFVDGFYEYADTDNDGIVTNWEYFLATNPNLPDGLDYVYDHFNWDHCANKQLFFGHERVGSIEDVSVL